MQDDWRVAQGLTVNAGVRYEYEFLPLPQQPNAALDAVFGRWGRRAFFRRTGIILGRGWGWRGSRLARGRAWCGLGMGCTLGGCRARRCGARWWIRRWRARRRSVRIVPTTVTDCPQVANQVVWVCVQLCDDSAGGGGGDDFGDGVRPAGSGCRWCSRGVLRWSGGGRGVS